VGTQTILDCAGNYFHYSSGNSDSIWWLGCRNALCLLYILMSFFKKYKTIYFQLIGFIILYYRFEKIILLLFCIALALLPLVFPKIALKYVLFFEKLLNLIGNLVKDILFTFVFCFIIIPISFIKRIFGKKSKPQQTKSIDLKKMW
jgi:hypothetical protein